MKAVIDQLPTSGEIELTLIKEHPDNPRKITEEDLDGLMESIKEDPDYFNARPVILSDRTGELIIIAGNQRAKAARRLDRKTVPYYLMKGLTEDDERRILLKDNGQFGKWDWERFVAGGFDKLPVNDWGVEIDKWILRKSLSDEDNYNIPTEIMTDIVPGDLFQIGKHRLMCGDSMNMDNIERLMDGEKGDMVFTDPPYGVAIGAKNRLLNSFQKAGRNLNDIKDDNIKIDELYQNLLTAFKNLKAASKDCCTYFVTAPQGGKLGMMMMMMMKEAGLPVRHVLIWYKNSPTFSLGRLDYEYQHESILLTWTKTHKYYGLGEHRTSVWKIDKPMANNEHPTMKPIALIENALLNNSTTNDIIIDIYLGSGSTMVACENLRRKCYGIEISPQYCQVILNRMRHVNPDIEIIKQPKTTHK